MLFMQLGNTDIKFKVRVTEMYEDGLVRVRRTGNLEPPTENIRVEELRLVTGDGKVLGRKPVDPPILLGPNLCLEVNWDLIIHAPAITRRGFETLNRFGCGVKGQR